MKLKLFRGDLVIWVIYFLLCGIGLIEVYSAGSQLAYESGDFLRPLLSQLGLIILCTVVVLFVHHIPCRFIRILGLFFYALSVVLLVWALVGGTNLNGGSRWIYIPIFGSFQPSEMAKGALITFVSIILSSAQRENGADKNAFSVILVFTGIICGLIVTQNLSTAAMIFCVIIALMWIGRIPGKQLYSLVGGLAFCAVAGYVTLRSLPDNPNHPVYSKVTRLSTWHSRLATNDMDTSMPPDSFVVTDGNRQEVHARIAFANSNGKGVGPGNSMQREFLAQAFSDFIYAIIAEELGFAGCFFVLLCYITLFIRAGRIASRCENSFPAFLILGLATLMVVQALLNMMVAVGLFPVTGQTLPMVSRGGSSMLITAINFGMMLSVSRYARTNGKRPIPNVAREDSAEIRKDFQKM